MLQNPDIAPSASINRWIMAIMSFHFILVHVPGSHHGPDGLSRRPRQPDDDPDPEEDDFEDWVDHLHGFLHFINDTPAPAHPAHLSRISSFVLTGDSQNFSEEENPTQSPSLSYNLVPRTDLAKSDDLCLTLV